MITIALALVLSGYTPTEAQSVFAQSNDAYHRQNWAEARAGYQRLIDNGVGGSDVLYNLGTTWLAEGNLGQGVLWLERSRRLDREDDVEANLAFARKQIVDEVVGDQGSDTFLERVASALDEQIASHALIATTWLFVLFVFVARRAKSALGPGLLAGLFFLLAVACAGLTTVHWWVARNIVEAVMQPPTAKVREGPGEEAKVLFEVHSGLKVRVREESGKFCRIRLPNGLEGWTHSEGVARL